VYRFQDRSVPPRFHRSKTINLTAKRITEQIDSYGKLLSEREVAVSQDEYRRVARALRRHRIRLVERQAPDEHCTGGTTESVKLFEDDRLVFDASVYHGCGDSGNLGGNVAALRSDLEQLLGDAQPTP
jgi:hypothetical protein